ncbi:MAG: hypothetical protein M1818_006778 [Claussenomyces sp. TS43310]|nr:MAG: hypothetical protein M1818_006778 [Claussenomyces sp. TS43310]
MADVSHTLSKCILIFAIHRNRSAEGVSLITQALYAMVFCARYLNIFTVRPGASYWNFYLKIFYTLSSFYIMFVMTRVYARTREREKAWKLGAYCLGGSLVATPVFTFIFRDAGYRGPMVILTVFSLILESVCILPQLLLLRQTSVPTVIDSYYLLTLGLYRALYIVNWIERDIENDWGLDPVAIIFGVIQTLLYFDFAWVYYTRQRVKLRNGGLVDSDDFTRSWLISKILGKKVEEDEDEESAPALGGNHVGNGGLGQQPENRNGNTKWGPRGISISADDSVLEHDRERQRRREGETDAELTDTRMSDPDEMARVLEEEDEEDEEESDGAKSSGHPIGVSGGEEWRDDSR